MVTIRIAGNEKTIDEADESWINKQINGRRHDGLPVCLQVTIKNNSSSFMLSSSQCASSGNGTFVPNDEQKRIIELWKKHKLNGSEFHGGNLIAFLKQLKG